MVHQGPIVHSTTLVYRTPVWHLVIQLLVVVTSAAVMRFAWAMYAHQTKLWLAAKTYLAPLEKLAKMERVSLSVIAVLKTLPIPREAGRTVEIPATMVAVRPLVMDPTTTQMQAKEVAPLKIRSHKLAVRKDKAQEETLEAPELAHHREQALDQVVTMDLVADQTLPMVQPQEIAQATTLLLIVVPVATPVTGRTTATDLEQIQALAQALIREMVRQDRLRAMGLVLAVAATAMLVPTQMQDPAQAAGQMEMATALGQIQVLVHLLGMDLGLILVLTTVVIPVEVVAILGQIPALARLLGMALDLETAMIPATTASLLTALVRVLMAALLQRAARLKVMVLKAVVLEVTALTMVALEVMPHRLHHRLT